VIDEVAAILLVMGAGPNSLTVAYTVAGFLAFRFFDVD
jgi:phosphatidylglycerophosphatase A